MLSLSNQPCYTPTDLALWQQILPSILYQVKNNAKLEIKQRSKYVPPLCVRRQMLMYKISIIKMAFSIGDKGVPLLST